jgi:hypothetical protein
MRAATIYAENFDDGGSLPHMVETASVMVPWLATT